MDRTAAVQNLKRKRYLIGDEDRNTLLIDDSEPDLSEKIRHQVYHLNSVASPSLSLADLASALTALHALSEYAKDEELVDAVANSGAVPVIVRFLLDLRDGNGGVTVTLKYELQRGCVSVLSLVAVKPEYQQLIVDAGALPHLIDFLRMHNIGLMSQELVGLLKKAADTITNLAHENTNIKNLIRIEGGIPPLVELLEFNDSKVQRAAAGALRTLAFKNDHNKSQIVGCNALPTLVLMLRSEDPTIHFEAVGVIGNLVHSSPNFKEVVLEAGALQPVIMLLSSSCSESQREAALLLGQFASSDSDSKVHIAQRGAIRPLVDLLKSADEQLREMSTFALGRLAQDSHNQAGIAYNGGIKPLLNLLGSKNGYIQHNAAFALYGLVDNEDNVADVIKVGGFQKLLDGHFKAQPTKECVAKTTKRLEEKIHGRVLKHLLYLMRCADKSVQRLVAIALAHLCSPDDCKTIFVDNNGLELLLVLVESSNLKQKSDASAALHKLAIKATSIPLVDAVLPSSSSSPQVYLGEEYVNNPKLSDVIFLVEGKRFYAHRVCLLASSDLFRAMFDGGYRESEAKVIEIPNIEWKVFELMMRFIYTGTVDVKLDIANDLLRAADQYLLDGLKRLCEHTISQVLSVENVSIMYHMSEEFNATSLRNSCILFVLEQFDKLRVKPCSICRYRDFVHCIAPDIHKFFYALLTKPCSTSS